MKHLALFFLPVMLGACIVETRSSPGMFVSKVQLGPIYAEVRYATFEDSNTIIEMKRDIESLVANIEKEERRLQRVIDRQRLGESVSIRDIQSSTGVIKTSVENVKKVLSHIKESRPSLSEESSKVLVQYDRILKRIDNLEEEKARLLLDLQHSKSTFFSDPVAVTGFIASLITILGWFSSRNAKLNQTGKTAV